MLGLGFALVGAGVGGFLSWCYFVPKIHALAREAEKQINEAQGKKPVSKK